MSDDPWTREAITVMTTQTLPETRTIARWNATRYLQTPANSVIGIIERSSALGSLRKALAFAGIAGDQIDVLDGPTGRQRLDGRYTGAAGRLRRWLHGIGLGPEAMLARQYGRELADGNLLVSIRNVDRALAEEVREIVLAHDGRCLQHYGRFTVAILAP
jgi:hypothetical protein